jgi:hypothetical protein
VHRNPQNISFLKTGWKMHGSNRELPSIKPQSETRLNEKVRMGSLAGQEQRKEVKIQVEKLLASSQIIYGSLDSVAVIDADAQKGAFISPLLLLNGKAFC